MSSSEKRPRFGWINSLWILSVVLLLALQLLWLNNTHQLINNQLVGEANEAFKDAYVRELAYRTPPVNAGNISSLTVQECGNEEVRIIRHCPKPDTLIYRNSYGRSLETVINRAFYELREKNTPLNVHCLADLFAGVLFERGIQANFVVEKWNTKTNKMLATSDMSGKVQQQTKKSHVLVISISETEELQAKLEFEQIGVFRRMIGIIIISLLLTVVMIACLTYQLRYLRRQNVKKEAIAGFTSDLLTRIETMQSQSKPTVPQSSSTFRLGQYSFNADSNELNGFGKTITLNKKENAILFELCDNTGKVVEREILLEKYWENTGFIYSRSLDTYIARLRKYLSEDSFVQIVTIKGHGYKLSLSES